MSRVDFTRFLTEQPDVTKAEVTDAMWADMGRRMYQTLMDEKFVKALVTAQLAAINPTIKGPPQQEMARMVRAYVFSGTIAQ